jgi:hypothetical protein
MKLPESPVKKTAVLMFVVVDDAVSSVRKVVFFNMRRMACK